MKIEMDNHCEEKLRAIQQKYDSSLNLIDEVSTFCEMAACENIKQNMDVFWKDKKHSTKHIMLNWTISLQEWNSH